ncbi:MAG: prepilin-type N-terminal cleavage/methylation domain-containing protein [Verrucomicrobia bacterium]|nr:prepilin-type N-terminal cleavage/methylation domain-containing protein [Verrucomicrobiota bacterium]MDE3097887.1 prepilin-type N-terminal cleavage/methylation domain-containing protein [Verrucomicrobiota bacterium]
MQGSYRHSAFGCASGFPDEKSRIGFTLVELLVVIGIIAILAAILLPALAQARRKALEIDCLSNVEQMTLAVTMYPNDFQQRFGLA